MNYINPYKLFHGAFIPNWLLRRQELSDGAKLVYARLCQFADTETGVAWPTLELLADECGTNRRSLIRHLQELGEAKLVESRQRGLQAPNEYRFLAHEWMGFLKCQNGTTGSAKMSLPEVPKVALPEVPKVAHNKNQDIRTIPQSLSEPSVIVGGDTDLALQKPAKSPKAKPPKPPKAPASTKARPSSLDEVLEYAKERRIPSDEAEKFYDHWQTTGWKRGKDAKIPIMDWQACFRTWERNYLERGGMRTPGNFKGISTLEYIEMMEAKHGKAEPLPPLPKDWDKHLRGYGEGHVG